MTDADLTVHEAAAILKLHPETIRRWIRDGRLNAYRLRTNRAGWRIPLTEVNVLKNSEPARP